MITIEVATEDDIYEVSLLWEALYKELYSNINPNKALWCLQHSQLLKIPNYIMYVAKDNVDNIIGFINAAIVHDPIIDKLQCNGYDLYTDPACKDKDKVAYKLYRAILKWIKNNNCEVFTFVCTKDNLNMWLKKGYECCSYIVRR